MSFLVFPSHPRNEWVKLFASRAVIVQPAMDAISAVIVADGQFDDAGDLEPEQAAEIFASPRCP